MNLLLMRRVVLFCKSGTSLLKEWNPTVSCQPDVKNDFMLGVTDNQSAGGAALLAVSLLSYRCAVQPPRANWGGEKLIY